MQNINSSTILVLFAKNLNLNSSRRRRTRRYSPLKLGAVTLPLESYSMRFKNDRISAPSDELKLQEKKIRAESENSRLAFL
jgi:hypothetical protein